MLSNNQKKILLFTFIFWIIRIFSYFFNPPTPLQSEHFINPLTSLFILFTSLFLIIKNNYLGWIIIAGEIILGGSGGYFSINFLSLRTILLVFSLSIFFVNQLITEKIIFLKNILKDRIAITIFVLIFWMIISSIIGFKNNHSYYLIFSNLIPYLFLLYYFPLKKLWLNNKFKKDVWLMTQAMIINNAIFILITLFTFSFNFFIEQGSFYHWFRDIALGKITDLKTGFFRIVLNEHLLLPALLLAMLYKQIKENKKYFYLIIPLLIILSINLTRIYFLAIFIGCLSFLFILPIKNTLKNLLICFFSFAIIFSSIHFISTSFTNFGLEFFGLRLSTITTPYTEESALSRMIILPIILEKIEQRPILGSGLGLTIEVYSPVFKDYIITEHIDWGYLEIIAETGLIGLLIWFSLIFFSFQKIISSKNKHLKIFIPILISFLIINITSPALFHVLGIMTLVVILSKEKNIFNSIKPNYAYK